MTHRRSVARLALPAALAAVALLSMQDLWNEARIMSARRASSDNGGPTVSAAPGSAQPASSEPPRLQLISGLRQARYAAALPPGAVRERLLATAADTLTQAADARPAWGEARAAAAFAYSQSAVPAAHAASVAALQQSYTAAPLLIDIGPWRASFAAGRWSLLSPLTREAALTEAQWLAGVAPLAREEVLAAFRQSPAYRDLMLRWRRGSVDPADVRL